MLTDKYGGKPVFGTLPLHPQGAFRRELMHVSMLADSDTSAVK